MEDRSFFWNEMNILSLKYFSGRRKIQSCYYSHITYVLEHKTDRYESTATSPRAKQSGSRYIIILHLFLLLHRSYACIQK